MHFFKVSEDDNNEGDNKEELENEEIEIEVSSSDVVNEVSEVHWMRGSIFIVENVGVEV